MLDCWLRVCVCASVNKCTCVCDCVCLCTVSLIFCLTKPSFQYTHSLEDCPGMPREECDGANREGGVCVSVCACVFVYMCTYGRWRGKQRHWNSTSDCLKWAKLRWGKCFAFLHNNQSACVCLSACVLLSASPRLFLMYRRFASFTRLCCSSLAWAQAPLSLSVLLLLSLLSLLQLLSPIHSQGVGVLLLLWWWWWWQGVMCVW